MGLADTSYLTLLTVAALILTSCGTESTSTTEEETKTIQGTVKNPLAGTGNIRWVYDDPEQVVFE